MRKLVLRTQVRRRSREYRRTGAGNGEARGPSDREQIECPHRPSPDARSHTSEVTMSSTPTANPNRNFVRERRRSATTAPSRFSLRYTTRRGYRTVFTRVSAPRPPVLPPKSLQCTKGMPWSPIHSTSARSAQWPSPMGLSPFPALPLKY